MKKQILSEQIRRMQKLAGIIPLYEDNHQESFDVNQDWNTLNVLGTETDHQGTWVLFADPKDLSLDDEGYSFAIEKNQIDQVANGKKVGVEDGSGISHNMTSQDAKNILSKLKIEESYLNESEDIASFLNANIDEFIQKVGDPGSEFETMGDPLVATAGTDDMSGIDVSFNREHMLELFPEKDPYNVVQSANIAGKTIYYNNYL